MRPYPGFHGTYFDMPCRNLVPKSLQKPHPPMWVACSKRETIHRAARAGLGALTFAFLEPALAAKWVQEYYDIIKSPACVPIGHSVNPSIALVTGMSCHADEQEAIRRGLDGFRFFGYSLGYIAIFGQHRPGVTNMWEQFLEVKDRLPDNAGRGGIGTPDQLRAHLKGYEDAGVDQVIFVQQSGTNRHEHICESLELFAEALLPAFKQRDAVREAAKQAELAPYIAQALARKPRMAAIDPADVPIVESFGRRGGGSGAQATTTFASDRGGAISVPAADPRVAAVGGSD
jgi:alkanesulfonate monooxygenase SsuD/methylene tetrahydromethanopterin reductase-like flavin-dependent oxidoreductase (luciferase family)